jgi:hypothetical protein
MALPMIAGLYVKLVALRASLDKMFIVDGRLHAYKPLVRARRLGVLRFPP